MNEPAVGSGRLKKIILAVVGLIALYFAYDQVLRYFVWSEETYGYYWQFRTTVLVHVGGGFIALLTGVYQLWSGLNRKAMRTHPITGRVYVVGILLGSFGGLALAVQSAVYGVAWAVALICLALAWLATTAMAIYSIRNRNIETHKRWMIRSYIVTFAFVTFRIMTDHVPYEAWWGMTRPEMSNAAIWPVWVMPLIAYEIFLALQDQRARS